MLMKINDTKIRYIFTFILCLINIIPGMAQVEPDILRRVHSNIQGFELKKLFKESESLKTSLIVERIEDIRLQCQLSYEEVPVNIQYPKSDIQLFGFRKQGVSCGDIVKTITVYDGRDNNIFLIGIDAAPTEDVKQIQYISGQMFLDNISIDFELEEYKPETYIDYIKLKMFDLQVDQLKFLKRKRGKLIFQGYSTFENKELEISVDPNSWNKKIIIETWL